MASYHWEHEPNIFRQTHIYIYIPLIGYIPNYSHLIGIMISKTIGFRGLSLVYQRVILPPKPSKKSAASPASPVAPALAASHRSAAAGRPPSDRPHSRR